MKLQTRLAVLERAAEQARSRDRATEFSVCDRIEELTVLYEKHPPTLPPAIEEGIRLAVEREERAVAMLAITRPT